MGGYMKRIFLITILILSIFTISSAKKVATNKVVTHPSASELNEGEYAVIKVPANITVTEIDSKKFKTNESRIFIAPGKYTFKTRLLGGFMDAAKTFTSEVEAGKFYIIKSEMIPGFLLSKTQYSIVETTKEDAEYPY
jgi:hypothetical protein